MMMQNQEIKKLIRNYLTSCVKSQFDIDIDLEKEYMLTENLVSKKTIIAPTFTNEILSNADLKLFLTSLVTEINNEKCSIEFIKEKMRSAKESDSQQMEMI